MKKNLIIFLSILILLSILSNSTSKNDANIDRYSCINKINESNNNDVSITLSQTYHQFTSLDIFYDDPETIITYPILDVSFKSQYIRINITNIISNDVDPRDASEIGLKINSTNLQENSYCAFYEDDREFSSLVMSFVFSCTSGFTKISFDIDIVIEYVKQTSTTLSITAQSEFESYNIQYCTINYVRSASEFVLSNVNKSIVFELVGLHTVETVTSANIPLTIGESNDFTVQQDPFVTTVTILNKSINYRSTETLYQIFTSVQVPRNIDTNINDGSITDDDENTNQDGERINALHVLDFAITFGIIVIVFISVYLIVRRFTKKKKSVQKQTGRNGNRKIKR